MPGGVADLGAGRCAGRQTVAPVVAALVSFLLTSIVFGAATPRCMADALTSSESAAITTATLPASNEAMLLFARVEQAVQQADWPLVLALRERLMEMGDELVVVPPGRIYYPIWRQATRIFERLPAEGRELYRRMYEAEAAARLKETAPSGDIAALRGLFRTYAGLSTWPAIGTELIAQLMDQGRFAEAIETIHVLGAAPGQSSPERRAQLVVALAALGQRQAARERLERMAADQALQQSPWPERLAAIRDWLTYGETSRGGSELDLEELNPVLTSGPLWCETLNPDAGTGAWEGDSEIADAVAFTRRLPLQVGVIEADTLLTRMRGTIWAFDALTLRPRWRVQELARSTPASEQFDSSIISLAMGAGPSGQRAGLSEDAHALLTDALQHGLSVGAGLVFTIQAAASSPSADDALGLARFGGADVPPPSNELVAREVATGNVVWRRGYDPADSLYDVSFQDVPIPVRDRLCAAVVRGAELHLLLLAPGTGETIADTEIVGPPTFFTGAGGRCQMLSDESSIYVATGNGVVAAVSAGDLSWKWATTYASTLASRRSSGWWPPHEGPREYGVDRPLLCGELLILAPLDAQSIFALERSTGRVRWRIERREDASLAGITEGGVLLAGSGLTCIEADDGESVRWRTVPLEITGRLAVGGKRIFVPTDDGVVVLDALTGKVLAEGNDAEGSTASRPGQAQTDAAVRLRLFSRRLPTANLVATPEALFAISPGCVVKFPDLGAGKRVCGALLSENPADERARMADIWLDLLSGDFAAALAKAEGFEPADAGLAQGREKLLTDIFVALSGSLGDQAERLALLRRAATCAEADDVSARLALLIGRALEENGDWGEVAQHYQELLAPKCDAMVGTSADPQHLQALWLHAAARLRLVSEHLASQTRDEFWQEWLNSGSPEFLERLRLATDEVRWQKSIDQSLVLSSQPAEIRARHLAGDDPDLPHERRLGLFLARWDIHVRLGLLAEAQADQREWEDRLKNLTESAEGGDSVRPSSAPASSSSALTLEGVRKLEAAMTELANAAAPALNREVTGRYCWKMPNAELMFDATGGPAGPTILARHLQDRTIGLHSVLSGRQYEEVPESSEGDSLVQSALDQMAEAWWAGGDGQDEEVFRSFWPAAVDGYMAAFAVRGELLGLGLGCERGTGEFWRQAIPEWNGVVASCGETLAAGASGVFVVCRQDQVGQLGWLDGAWRWKRSLTGLRVERLLPVGERLVIVGRDGEVISIAARDGDNRRDLSPVGGAPLAVAIVADTVVVWTEDRVGGYDPVSFECLWMRPSRGVEDWLRISASDWVAYRERGEPDWRLVDAVSGDSVFTRGLGPVGGKVTAGALDGKRLLIAGFERKAASPDRMPLVRLTAFDAESGQRIWEREIPSLVRVNESQLRASPDLIPVLVARSDYEYTETRDYNTLALLMVDKESGEATEPVSVWEDFRGTQGQCAAYLLATPSRIIVQANGTIAAYGPASGKR